MTSSVVLASASPSRAALLRNAGIVAACRPAGIDETVLKSRGQREGWAVEAVASALAKEKALAVSRQAPDAWVIGADQMLDCEGQWLDKTRSDDEVRQQLRFLRGRGHRLVSAVAVSREASVKWATVDEARLVMRPFSDSFIDRYVHASGGAAVGTVGGYRLEDHGIQLFSAIEGDYFTILGLPLLPLLAYLRSVGAIED